MLRTDELAEGLGGDARISVFTKNLFPKLLAIKVSSK